MLEFPDRSNKDFNRSLFIASMFMTTRAIKKQIKAKRGVLVNSILRQTTLSGSLLKVRNKVDSSPLSLSTNINAEIGATTFKLFCAKSVMFRLKLLEDLTVRGFCYLPT